MVIILILAVGCLLGGCFLCRLQLFRRELRQIRSEIDRTAGAEREYWRRRCRQLWMSLLFFRD